MKKSNVIELFPVVQYSKKDENLISFIARCLDVTILPWQKEILTDFENKMAEKHIERKCCDIAGKAGWKHCKHVSPGRRGGFDHIFIREGLVIFVEFKQPGKKLDPLQLVEYNELLLYGAEAHVCNNIQHFKGILDIPDS